MKISLQGELVNIYGARAEILEFAKDLLINGATLPGQADTSSSDKKVLKAVRFELREGKRLMIVVKNDEVIISAAKQNLEYEAQSIEQFARNEPLYTDYHIEYTDGFPLFEGPSLSLVILLTSD